MHLTLPEIQSCMLWAHRRAIQNNSTVIVCTNCIQLVLQHFDNYDLFRFNIALVNGWNFQHNTNTLFFWHFRKTVIRNASFSVGVDHKFVKFDKGFVFGEVIRKVKGWFIRVTFCIFELFFIINEGMLNPKLLNRKWHNLLTQIAFYIGISKSRKPLLKVGDFLSRIYFYFFNEPLPITL